jgi:hypothetical protein
MTNLSYQITGTQDGKQTLTFVDAQGDLHTVTNTMINYQDTLDAVLAGDSDQAVRVSLPLNAVVERIRSAGVGFDYDGRAVTFGGTALDAKATDLLLGFSRAGNMDKVRSLARFFGRLSANPSKRSVEMLYAWINDVGLTIDADGFIIAHKGITNKMESRSHGTAFVNGVQYTGAIPNKVGDTVSMTRNQVTDDPSHTCSQGLHVGSLSYASKWAPVLITVRIDPADVVSVPVDGEKMRVSKYVVVKVNEKKAEFSSDGSDGYFRGKADDFETFQDIDDDCPCSACARLRR